jgi:exodeoxyribonuclease-5
MVKKSEEQKGWDKRVDELVDKDMIKPEQSDGMKKMISSPDKENMEVAREIVKLKLEERLIIGLNEDQIAAFNDILTFLREGTEDAFVLKGYAGTGKTFLVKRIIEYITASYPQRRIAITAPTNKAVRVLQYDAPFNENSGNEMIMEDLFNIADQLTYSTVHKLLGLKEQISNTGVQTFKPDYKDKSELDKYKYLIVDEVSMLDDILCRELQKYSNKVKIIYMGDPAQIPPVNRIDCIPFREQDQFVFRRAELHKIMRQTGEHPVVDASFIIRNNLNVQHPIPKLETNLKDDKGIVFIDGETERKSVKGILADYFDTDEFKADADYAKVIAWRNKTVDYLNGIIRVILFGEKADPYMVGEKLIARGPIFKEQKGPKSRWGAKWIVDLHTSEEMEISKIDIENKKFTEGSYKLYAQIYKCQVLVQDPLGYEPKSNTIEIIHEDSLQEYRELLKKTKSLAIKARDKSAWVSYYNILKWSADVGYNYAITAHKAQGSTYENVILIEEDLDKNRTTVERNRIKYTAYSRPKNKLFILRKNYV